MLLRAPRHCDTPSTMTDDSHAPWTVGKLINWTRQYLVPAGIDQPRLAAELLLAHVLRCRRIDLYTRFDYQPTPEELTAFRKLIKRAALHEPVAYLTGRKEFYSMEFRVTADVLIPRPETEILVCEAISRLRAGGRESTTMWDICTGSGCVGIAVAANVPGVRVLATDISPQAVAVAAANAEAHGLGDRVRCRAADLLALPKDCRAMLPFNVIAANPPYVADDDEVAATVEHEPPEALRAGKAGLDFLRPIIRDAGDFLNPGGAMLLEFGCGQADEVRNLIAETDAFAEPHIIRDHQGIERAAAATRR